MVGAVCGFVLGFMLDSVLLATLGISSLTLLDRRATWPAATARARRSRTR